MKVFISWSGERSQAIANALREWLPNVIQALEPWMSATDIEKGARWSSDIATQLEETSVGIICLTSDNLEAPWIHFEAGALSKTLEKSFVCPYLFDLEPTDLKGPLVQFQAAKANKQDTRKLLHTINRAQGERALAEDKINKAFDVWWDELEKRLKVIPSKQEKQRPKRAEREILEEILELVRAQRRENKKTSPSLTLESRIQAVQAVLNLTREQAKNFIAGVNHARHLQSVSEETKPTDPRSIPQSKPCPNCDSKMYLSEDLYYNCLDCKYSEDSVE